MPDSSRNFNMFRWLNLLLLFCFAYHIEIVPKPVTGKRGGSVTLPCQFEDREISDTVLSSQSKNILVCQNEECKSENDRVFKEGSCDVIIKDLKLSDAGRYFLRLYYNNDQRELERQISIYHLQIHDEISVKTGEQLKMDVLLINVYQIEHQSKISTEWTEAWTRGDGVQNDRLTDSDGNLTINAFTASDAGTYRVLDSEGEIWITVTVTESSTGSKVKLDTDEDKPDEKYTAVNVVLSVSAALLALIIPVIIWKYRCQHRNTEHDPTKGSQSKTLYSSPEHLVTTLGTCNLPSEPTDPQRILSTYVRVLTIGN
ncbi:uncharacterized protein [Chanodichthys erythropterus]|uniref:uncharacterized protein n=1 Tax=Chanodichthys erythropterus TaxID=933992 RepID=UPI00351F4904